MTNEQLVLRIRSGEDVAENMAALYEQNRGIIAKLAFKYQHYAEFDDLMQEGYIGLCHAVDSWKPNGGANFITYAIYWIKQTMYRYVENTGSCIRVPAHKRQNIREYNKYRQQFLKTLGREPEVWELCRLMGVSKNTLEQIKSDQQYLYIDTLDRFVGEDDDTVLSELVADPEDKYECILDEVEKEELKATIWPLVDTLDRQQSAALYCRYKDGKTLKETGMELGITPERVRIVQNNALRILRSPKYTRILASYFPDLEIYHRGIQGTVLTSFRRSWTSATEREALWALEHD